MVASFHETQSKRKNKRGLPDYLWMLQRALEGRSGRTERSRGAQGRIMHQRPKNQGALNKPTGFRSSAKCTTVHPFSQKSRTPTVAKEFQIGLYDPAARLVKSQCTCSSGVSRETSVTVGPSFNCDRSLVALAAVSSHVYPPNNAHLFHAGIQRVQACLLRLAIRGRCTHSGFDCVLRKRAEGGSLTDHAKGPQRHLMCKREGRGCIKSKPYNVDPILQLGNLEVQRVAR